MGAYITNKYEILFKQTLILTLEEVYSPRSIFQYIWGVGCVVRCAPCCLCDQLSTHLPTNIVYD